MGKELPNAGRLVHNPFAALGGKASESKLEAKAEPSRPAGKLIVRRERSGRGGKGVTVAEGGGLAAVDLAALAREAAKALGTGARVEEGRLVVQGEMGERLKGWLEGRGLGPVTLGN
jgi:translation initiation factor 1